MNILATLYDLTSTMRHLLDLAQTGEIDQETLEDTIEAMDLTQKSHKKWENNTKVIIELQNKWKEIGAASNKNERKLYKRFRSACDAFFKAKSEFFKTIKKEFAANLEKKKELCATAKKLTENLTQNHLGSTVLDLQFQWKEAGRIPRDQGEELNAEFKKHCDLILSECLSSCRIQ